MTEVRCLTAIGIFVVVTFRLPVEPVHRLISSYGGKAAQVWRWSSTSIYV